MYYTSNTEDRRIVWDENKNTENKLKHKIGFEDAQYVFADPDRIERVDRSESNTSCETRWQTIGKVGDLFFCCLHRDRGRYAPDLCAGSQKT